MVFGSASSDRLPLASIAAHVPPERERDRHPSTSSKCTYEKGGDQRLVDDLAPNSPSARQGCAPPQVRLPEQQMLIMARSRPASPDRPADRDRNTASSAPRECGVAQRPIPSARKCEQDVKITARIAPRARERLLQRVDADGRTQHRPEPRNRARSSGTATFPPPRQRTIGGEAQHDVDEAIVAIAARIAITDSGWR